MGEKTKQKQGKNGVGDKIKITLNVGSVNKNLILNPNVRSCGEVKKRKLKLMRHCVLGASKANWCNGCEVDKGGNSTRRGQRSSSSLRVVTIQTRYLHQRLLPIVS